MEKYTIVRGGAVILTVGDNEAELQTYWDE